MVGGYTAFKPAHNIRLSSLTSSSLNFLSYYSQIFLLLAFFTFSILHMHTENSYSVLDSAVIYPNNKKHSKRKECSTFEWYDCFK